MSIITIHDAVRAHETWVDQFFMLYQASTHDVRYSEELRCLCFQPCLFGTWLQSRHAASYLGQHALQRIVGLHEQMHATARVTMAKVMTQQTAEHQQSAQHVRSLSSLMLTMLQTADNSLHANSTSVTEANAGAEITPC